MQRNAKVIRCKQCEDKGFVLFKQINENISYEHIAYCDKCEKGNDYKYCGKDYYISPFSAYAVSKVFEQKRVENTIV